MRKVKKPTITWKYTGDENPEKRLEAEQNLQRVYNRIFNAVREKLIEEKGVKQNLP